MDEPEADSREFRPKFHVRPTIQKWVTEKVKEAQLNGLVATVIPPSGKSKDVDIFENGQETYSVSFQPKEHGPHKLKLERSGEQVPGSPFEFNVKEHAQGGREKVIAYGLGLKNATTTKKAKFDILTSEAGEGKLEVSIHGPSKADLGFLDRKDGSNGVTYAVSEPGLYLIHIKFDGEHISGSPFEVCASGNGADDAFSRAQVKIEQRCIGEKISATTFPSQLPLGYSDATKVQVTGEGLKRGKVGKASYFLVDCAEAETNLLMAGIVGPTSPCKEIYVNRVNQKCYEVKYFPRESGDFHIIVKWGDENVKGSPFRAIISP